MIQIGICDENAQDRKKIRELAAAALFSCEEVRFIEYADAGTLKKDIMTGDLAVNLLLMEIRYETENGMKLANKIRTENLDLDMIFVTNETAYVYDGYAVKAQGYILKDQMEEMLPLCIRRYMEQYQNSGIVTVKCDSVSRRVQIRDVLYVESLRRELIFHTKQEDIRCYGKLTDLEKDLESYGFLRVHQSYLVNRNALSAISASGVDIGEQHLPVSRRYSRQVQEYFRPVNQKYEEEETGDSEITITKSLAAGQVNRSGAIVGISGGLLGTIYRMAEGENLAVGRDPEICQIIVTDREVSRVHCRLTYLADTEEYQIEDLSKNGVYVQDKKIGKGNVVRVCAGAKVRIDNYTAFRLG